jgi:hypothetical protein
VQINTFVLETQMRAGTHYLLYALYSAYRPVIHYPLRSGSVRRLTIDDLKGGLGGKVKVPTTPEDESVEILFRHYYHNLDIDPLFHGSKKVALIGYPFDSFYSDGLVFSSDIYSAAPSNIRQNSTNYILKHSSKEWDFLYPYMLKNANWLKAIANDDAEGTLIVRYEDLIDNFVLQRERIINFLGIMPQTPFPEPHISQRRIYWSGGIHSRFDDKALYAMNSIFSESLKIFYPERTI